MSEPAPDLGTAWRLLDEARAELDKAHERTAELVSEVNRVTAERDELREQLSADLIVWNTCSACEAMERGVEQARAERDETRAAFAELAAHFGKGAQSGWTARISGTVLYRLCLAAKVPDPDGIIIGAGTAHLAEQLLEQRHAGASGHAPAARQFPPERHPPGADAGPHDGEAAYLDDQIGGMT